MSLSCNYSKSREEAAMDCVDIRLEVTVRISGPRLAAETFPVPRSKPA